MSTIATLLGINNSSSTEENTPTVSSHSPTHSDNGAEAPVNSVPEPETQVNAGAEAPVDSVPEPETRVNAGAEAPVDSVPEPETRVDADVEANTPSEETPVEQKVEATETLPNTEDGNEEDEVPDIGDHESVPDIELKSVPELQSVLGDMKYEDIRKGLYKKYGLVTKDEASVPGLYMITYNKPDRNSSKNKVTLTKEQQRVVSQYRGVIVEKDTNRPVCYTFNKMSRHFPDEWKLEDCNITVSCDGSQIKVFFHQQKNHWVVSTTRRIDAARSYFFSNKSFMEMWQDASNSLNWNKLDKNCCYSFVLAHPDNRVVARHNKPFLTHVFTRNMTTFEAVSDDIGIPRPQPINFKTKNDIWKSIKRLPYYKEGYVVQKGDAFIKLVNSKYQEVKELRGSSSSLLFHYFHLKKQNKVRQFLSYYPESSETFKYFNDCFENLCVLAYNEYVLLRVRKVIQPPQVLRFLKPVLYRVHGIHLKNKARIRLSNVRSHLEEYPPFMLRKLVDMANGLPYSFN